MKVIATHKSRPSGLIEFDVSGKRLVRFGKDQRSEVHLKDGPFIPPAAAALQFRSGGWVLEALEYDSVRFAGKLLKKGQRLKCSEDFQLEIHPYELAVVFDPVDQEGPDPRYLLGRRLSETLRTVHASLLDHIDLDVSDEDRLSLEYLKNLEEVIERIVEESEVFATDHGAYLDYVAGQTIRSQLIAQLAEGAPEKSHFWDSDKKHWSRIVSDNPARKRDLDQEADALLNSVRKEVEGKRAAEVESVEREVIKLQARLGEFADQGEEKEKAKVSRDIQRLEGSLATLRHPRELESRIMDAIDHRFWDSWDDNASRIGEDFKHYLALRFFKKAIKDIVFGYGPLEDLLRAPSVTEIMVVDRDHIFVERSGVVESSGRRFISDEVTLQIVQRIVSEVDREINTAKPLVDARLNDGSRVNAVIPPLAVRGPCLTIRKFPEHNLTIDDLLKFGTITPSVRDFLRAAVINSRSILVSGGTGTGKTTLLNCLGDFIPNAERLITIEDTAELQIKKEHVVSLETREKNRQGKGEYTIRDLVRNALRMRPNRIIVGECRGPEALDMLQAMNTGHAGSMTTIHANSTEDAILRLEVLVGIDSKLATELIRQQIVSAIDIVVQLQRVRRQRLVTQVSEVIELDQYTGRVRTKDLFAVSSKSEILKPTGHLPTFMAELIERGLLDENVFFLD